MMKKCIVIPDSFKGTLSAIQICDIMKESVLKHYSNCNVISIPVADGGEGTVDCFVHAVNAEKIPVQTTGPFGEPIQAYYARYNQTAIIETASAAGLPQAEGRLNPCKATTYGMGAIILDAIKKGCTEIVLGLGGSCTNDGGCGVAAALGAKFYNENNNTFIPTGDTLRDIRSIDLSETKKLLAGCTITAMCDIDNPMFGPLGAAYIFAPQKGADEAAVKLLDQNLIALSGLIEEKLGLDVSKLPGSGAAGALGAGVVAFLGGSLKSGIETILDLIHFNALLDGADMVFTGEGRIDSQSLNGKAISGIAKRAMEKNVPVTVIAGSIGQDLEEEPYHMGVTAIFSINREAKDFEISRYQSETNLKKTMNDLLRFYKNT